MMNRLKGALRGAVYAGGTFLVILLVIGLPIAAGVWLNVWLGWEPDHPLGMLMGFVLMGVEFGAVVGWLKAGDSNGA